MQETNILWADDEIDLLKPHIMLLNEKGYRVKTVTNGNDAVDAFKNGFYDLVFLDENMPGLTGLETLFELKNINPAIPMVLVTKNEEEHLMEDAIGSKIDDYLIKPFDLNELSARLRALCRRTTDGADALPIGGGRLDLALRDVVLPDGTRVPLSAREFELLRVLALRPRVVHSRAELRRRVFDDATAPSIVDTYVYYLRRKLGRGVVRTVHGLGYRLGEL